MTNEEIKKRTRDFIALMLETSSRFENKVSSAHYE